MMLHSLLPRTAIWGSRRGINIKTYNCEKNCMNRNIMEICPGIKILIALHAIVLTTRIQ